MKETEFLGRVTAIVMHDLQNVLAIIKEASGLIDDLLPMSKGLEPKRRDQFQHNLGHIKEQVDRGAKFTELLNSFGHSMEDCPEGADLESCARQIAFLSQRFARMKRIEFLVDPAEERQRVPHPRFQVMMAVFAVMEACLQELPALSKVHIRAEAVNHAPGLCFHWPDVPHGEDLALPIAAHPQGQNSGNLPPNAKVTSGERNASVCLSFA